MCNAFDWKRRRSGLVVKLLRILPGKFSGDWTVGLGGELSFGVVQRGAGNGGAVAYLQSGPAYTENDDEYDSNGHPKLYIGSDRQNVLFIKQQNEAPI